MFQSAILIAKPGSDCGLLQDILDELKSRGMCILLDTACAELLRAPELAAAPEAMAEGELGIVAGGDGALLSAARLLAPHGIPLLGINTGRLGFLTDAPPAKARAYLRTVLDGHYKEEVRLTLQCEVHRDGRTLHEDTAVNEIVIQKRNVARLFEFEARIDGVFAYRQRGDGVIVATPTGSTAYALASGGPLLFPDLDVLELVPICPHTLSHRPLVLDADRRVEVRVSPTGTEHAGLTCDGRALLEILPGDCVQIRRQERKLRLLHPPEHDHFHVLRAKLGWGGTQC